MNVEKGNLRLTYLLLYCDERPVELKQYLQKSFNIHFKVRFIFSSPFIAQVSSNRPKEEMIGIP
jgi:hypothetical protein